MTQFITFPPAPYLSKSIQKPMHSLLWQHKKVQSIEGVNSFLIPIPNHDKTQNNSLSLKTLRPIPDHLGCCPALPGSFMIWVIQFFLTPQCVHGVISLDIPAVYSEGILVYLESYNKLPLTRWFKWQIFLTVLEVVKSKIKLLADPLSGEGTLSVLQMLISFYSHMISERERSMLPSSCKGTNLIMKAQSSNTITLGIKISAYKWEQAQTICIG